MKRRLSPEERRLWAQVARTVERRTGVSLPEEPPADAPAAPLAPPAPAPNPAKAAARAAAEREQAEQMARALAMLAAGVRHSPPPRPGGRAARHGPDPLEPRRLRRISRERDPIEARIDLHGMTQFEAEDRLKAFIRSAYAQGMRAVLVVTGKGYSGDGIIRRRAPEWLASRDLREMVAGVSSAARRHGGEGALYVALKRRE